MSGKLFTSAFARMGDKLGRLLLQCRAVAEPDRYNPDWPDVLVVHFPGIDLRFTSYMGLVNAWYVEA